MKELETLPLDQNYSERIIKAAINKALKNSPKRKKKCKKKKKTIKKEGLSFYANS